MCILAQKTKLKQPPNHVDTLKLTANKIEHLIEMFQTQNNTPQHNKKNIPNKTQLMQQNFSHCLNKE